MIYRIEAKLMDGLQTIHDASIYDNITNDQGYTYSLTEVIKTIEAEVVEQPFLYGKLVREYVYWDSVVKWISYFVEADTMSEACRQAESLKD